MPPSKKKGDVLDTLAPYLVVNLAPNPVKLPEKLPRAKEIQEFLLDDQLWKEHKDCNEFVTRALGKGTTVAYTVVTTLAVALLNKPICIHQTLGIGTGIVTDEPDELVTEAWPLVQSILDWPSWLTLYCQIRRTLFVTSVPHPLTLYAKQVVAQLDEDDLKIVYDLLQPEFNLPPTLKKENIYLCLVQAIQDYCPPIPVGIVPRGPSEATKHSCLPNAAWDYNPGTQELQVIALHDLEVNEVWKFSVIEGGTFQERQAAFHQTFGGTCNCSRCHWEKTKTLPTNVTDVVRLGHFHFQHDRLEGASHSYRHALSLDSSLADIWHAVGAVLLTQNKFKTAQRHWRDAVEKHPFLKNHTGIALQLAKQQAYGYFKEVATNDSTGCLINYTSRFGGLCFVTDEPAISQQDCSQVIQWAESNTDWTTSRHYAVPTMDVPVHTIPQIFTWFNKWMDSTARPLLGKQFGVAPEYFYCHDAFVVRYEATKSNNFLPIHVDESTHSFVLALNGDFEGGGTYFSDYYTTLAPKTPGCLVTFRGDSLRHGGNVVTSGTRYILAVFLYHDPPPSRKRPLSTENKESFSFGFQL